MTSVEGKVGKLVLKSMPMEMSLGGTAEFTTSDIAASLSGISEPCLLAGLVYYTNEIIKPTRDSSGQVSPSEMRIKMARQNKLVLEFCREVEELIVRRCDRNGWKLPKQSPERFVKHFAQLLVIEYSHNGQCTACHGTKWNKDRATACARCSGSGRRSTTMQYKADYVAMDRKTWTRNWEDKQLDLLSTLQGWRARFDHAIVTRAK